MLATAPHPARATHASPTRDDDTLCPRLRPLPPPRRSTPARPPTTTTTSTTGSARFALCGCRRHVLPTPSLKLILPPLRLRSGFGHIDVPLTSQPSLSTQTLPPYFTYLRRYAEFAKSFRLGEEGRPGVSLVVSSETQMLQVSAKQARPVRPAQQRRTANYYARPAISSPFS